MRPGSLEPEPFVARNGRFRDALNSPFNEHSMSEYMDERKTRLSSCVFSFLQRHHALRRTSAGILSSFNWDIVSRRKTMGQGHFFSGKSGHRSHHKHLFNRYTCDRVRDVYTTELSWRHCGTPRGQ